MVHLSYLAVAFGLALGVLRLAVTIIRRARSPLSSVPGPWYTKYTSLYSEYLLVAGNKIKYVEGLHQKYGPVVRLGPDEVDFSSIAGAKRIHSYRNPFPKSSFYSKIRNARPSVFNSTDIEYHAHKRRLVSAPISESSLKNMEGIVGQRIDLAIQRMGEEMKSRGVADVFKWWLFLTTDVVGELSFGDSFRMLEQGKKNQYVQDLEGLAATTAVRVVFPTLFKYAFILPIPAMRAVRARVNRVISYASESIRRYESMIAANPQNPKPTLFTKLYRAGEEGLSREDICVEAQSYIIAGSDTTAVTLTYLVWAVCKQPLIKQRIIKEVATLREGFKDDDVKALPYLNQVIKETLRLYASAPAQLPREVTPGGSEIDGYWFPSGTVVSTQAYSMHRNPTVFPQPEQFNPSRWEDPTKDMKDAFMAFGGGARTCLGIHLAELELRKATAAFFRTYPNAKVSTRENFADKDMEQALYFLMSPKGKRCLIQGS